MTLLANTFSGESILRHSPKLPLLMNALEDQEIA